MFRIFFVVVGICIVVLKYCTKVESCVLWHWNAKVETLEKGFVWSDECHNCCVWKRINHAHGVFAIWKSAKK